MDQGVVPGTRAEAVNADTFFYIVSGTDIKAAQAKVFAAVRILGLKTWLLKDRRFELKHINTDWKLGVPGLETAFPSADLLFFLFMAAMDVDGAIFHPEVGVLTEFAPDF